ncbi:RDD family protein [Pseudonocardia sp. C8]|uniref:RDD family protein n=1 Tax=Pseudonocardia sp. C8 TaxID=2762759 RepID=UPI0016429079|nr:RDD family protein [Pseudonocardia sp. C8]MBC3192889.1 RDD family protein [Pseudonocardia sp. C8]
MARWIESWLPGSPTGPGDDAAGHAGKRFGLPASGHYSVAGVGRRIAGVCLDWLLAYLLVVLVAGTDVIGTADVGWWVLGTWFVFTVLTVAVLGSSPGHLALGMRVARTDMAEQVGVPRALLRTAMIAVVIPVFFLDADGRGWHDRASSTIVVRVIRA